MLLLINNYERNRSWISNSKENLGPRNLTTFGNSWLAIGPTSTTRRIRAISFSFGVRTTTMAVVVLKNFLQTKDYIYIRAALSVLVVQEAFIISNKVYVMGRKRKKMTCSTSYLMVRGGGARFLFSRLIPRRLLLHWGIAFLDWCWHSTAWLGAKFKASAIPVGTTEPKQIYIGTKKRNRLHRDWRPITDCRKTRWNVEESIMYHSQQWENVGTAKK